MELYFITGSINKYDEIKSVIPNLKQLKINLPEIQELNPKKIIEEKLKKAEEFFPSLEFIVEDTGLYLDCLDGFPGPLIKWFLKENSLRKIHYLTEKLENNNATAKTVIGYRDNLGNKLYFEGESDGKIVLPKVESNFGWDPIFKPNGYELSFGEMSREEKNKISMRKIAAEKLKDYLEH